ncbi:nitrogen fixation protein NifZ [Vibrio sp. WXL210]|uniref:nitrogen fixation protein NifZ n=1 Tax=Vibrio sp. WXL210 TaxID=3450709 RepID=UPI003EC5E963
METKIRFEIGDEVRVVRTIRSDGTLGEELGKGKRLVTAGEVGYVRSMGFFLQDQVIYRVYFPSEDREIGVRNEELICSTLPWHENPFHRKQKVRLAASLAHNGQIFSEKGEWVEIRQIKRDLETGLINYLVLAKGHWIWLAQGALQAPSQLQATSQGASTSIAS